MILREMIESGENFEKLVQYVGVLQHQSREFDLLVELEDLIENGANPNLILRLLISSISSSLDESVFVEYINLGQTLIASLSQNNLVRDSLNEIVEFYIAAGNAYWDRKIYQTAITIFEDAIYFLQSLNPKSESLPDLILKKLKYWMSLKQYNIAARDASFGYQIANSLDLTGWTEAFRHYVISTNAVIAEIHAHTAQSLIWDGDEKRAKNSILRSLHALAEIFDAEGNFSRSVPLARLIVDVFSTIRILSEEDALVINLLRSALKNQENVDLKDLSSSLMRYYRIAYVPKLFTILCLTPSGTMVYSEDFVYGKETDELSLFSKEGKHLYSGIFSALNMTMKGALGDSSRSNLMEYSGKSILVEETESFLIYLVSDRETPELRKNLIDLSNDAENGYSRMPEMTISSTTEMKKLFQPLVEKYLQKFE